MSRAELQKSRESLPFTSLRFVLGCLLCVLVFLVVSCDPPPPGDAETPTQGATVPAGHEETAIPKENDASNVATAQVIAYYFHNTIRCVSCLEIEKTAREAIAAKFESELDDGSLKWRVVNMELDKNKHFITDYDLAAPSLVYSQIGGKQQVNWRRLDQVWELLDDPEALGRYVQDELSKCLRAR